MVRQMSLSLHFRLANEIDEPDLSLHRRSGSRSDFAAAHNTLNYLLFFNQKSADNAVSKREALGQETHAKNNNNNNNNKFEKKPLTDAFGAHRASVGARHGALRFLRNIK
jgi:hypothetical protein